MRTEGMGSLCTAPAWLAVRNYAGRLTKNGEIAALRGSTGRR
jgi:hypothetical protein